MSAIVTKVTKKTDSPSFEETLTELDAIEKFERGIALSREGQKSLEQAEQKVKILLNEQGESALHPLPEDEQP